MTSASSSYVGDFVSELATHVEGYSAVDLTLGDNLLVEVEHEGESLPSGAIVSLYSETYDTPEPRFGYRLIEWPVLITANGSTRLESINSIRPLVNALVEDRAFTLPGFAVKNVRVESAPEFVSRNQSGRFRSQATLLFFVIPTA